MSADLSLSVGRAGLKQRSLSAILDSLAEMYHYGQTLPHLPELAETSNMDLRSLLETLFRSGGIAAVKDFFSAHAYRISQPSILKGTRFDNLVVGIKYIDGLNNLWQPRWAREGRGRFYYYDPETCTVITLKDTLQRGVEVLTDAHAKKAITETQDMRLDAYDHLDDCQRACIRSFMQPEGAPIDAYLTGKVDGSLMIVSIYPRGTTECQIMEEILAIQGPTEDTFAQRLATACNEAKAPLIVVATQGTLFIGSDMQDYFLTSLQSLLGPIPDEIQRTVKDVWNYYAPLFVTAVQDFIAATSSYKHDLTNNRRVHICFEAFCRNRRGFRGHLHTELAISYDHDGFNLLGAMVDGNYIPHFDLPNTVFAQPIHLRVSNTLQVFAIMEDMDRVVMGDLTPEAFMTRYGFPTTATIHMEGWVLLAPSGATYDYAKIKTNLYYKCHKIRSREVPTLLALPTSCDDTYPILRVLREFYANADRRITETVLAAVAMLESEVALGSASEFYTALNPKARGRFTPESDRNILMRILINTCSEVYRPRIRAILKKIWELEEVHDDMIYLVTKILMKTMPWDVKVSAALKEQVRREAMQDLYRILVESMNPT